MTMRHWLNCLRLNITPVLSSCKGPQKRKPANPGLSMTENLEVRSLLSANSLAIVSNVQQSENGAEHAAEDRQANQTRQEATFGRAAMKAKKPKPDKHSANDTDSSRPGKPHRENKADKPNKPNKHNNRTPAADNDPYFLQQVASNTAPSIAELGNEVGNQYFPNLIDSLSTYGASALEQTGNSADWNAALQRLENIANGLVNDGWTGAAQAGVPGILELGDEFGSYYFSNLINSLSDYGAGVMEQSGSSLDWNTALQRLDQIGNSFINDGWLGAAQAGLPGIEEFGSELGDYLFPGLSNTLSDYGVNAWDSWTTNTSNNSYSIVYDDNAPRYSSPGDYFSGSDWDTAWQGLQQIGNAYYNDGWEGAAMASLPAIGQFGEELGNYYFPDWIDSASNYGLSLYDAYNDSSFSDDFWSAFDASISQYDSENYWNYEYPTYDYGSYGYSDYDYGTYDYGTYDYGTYSGSGNTQSIVYDDNAPKVHY